MSENTFFVPRWPDNELSSPSVVIPCSGWSESQAWSKFDAFVKANPELVIERTGRPLPQSWRARKATYSRIGVVMQRAKYTLI